MFEKIINKDILKQDYKNSNLTVFQMKNCRICQKFHFVKTEYISDINFDLWYGGIERDKYLTELSETEKFQLLFNYCPECKKKYLREN